MTQEQIGTQIPGSVTTSVFARTPATFIREVIETGKSIVILKNSKALVTLVPAESADIQSIVPGQD
jgi:hypothetical protein